MSASNQKMGAPVRLPEGDNPVATFRRERGLSQQQAAAALGVERSAVAKYESGALATPRYVLIIIELRNKLDGLGA